MKETRTLSLRLPIEEYIAFDTVCREKGYSKTGKIREFIRNMVKEEIESVKISAHDWAEIEKGIIEIQKGEYVTFEELKRDLKRQKVADNKNRK
jgi:hypothetical protein